MQSSAANQRQLAGVRVGKAVTAEKDDVFPSNTSHQSLYLPYLLHLYRVRSTWRGHEIVLNECLANMPSLHSPLSKHPCSWVGSEWLESVVAVGYHFSQLLPIRLHASEEEA